MMVRNGRLPGATTLRLAGSRLKAWPRFIAARHHDAQLEAHVVALDERDHHAALVGLVVDRAALDVVAGDKSAIRLAREAR